MFLPLLFKKGLSCLIVGGGQVAARKAEILAEASCAITIVAPHVTGRIAEEVQRGFIRLLQREYVSGDCKGYHFVIAATPDNEINRRISDEARNLGIPVNVVDDPALSTVIFPAVWRDGALVIAVSTEGVAPFMAAEIRTRLGGYARQMGRWVEIAGRFREIVRNEVKDPDEKSRLYKRFLEAGEPDESDNPPDSSRLSDWLSWLDNIRNIRAGSLSEN